MVLFIMEITRITNQMVEENLRTIKDKFMKDNGKMEPNKVKGFGKAIEERHTWANG